jgi:hypothetical protein
MSRGGHHCGEAGRTDRIVTIFQNGWLLSVSTMRGGKLFMSTSELMNGAWRATPNLKPICWYGSRSNCESNCHIQALSGAHGESTSLFLKSGSWQCLGCGTESSEFLVIWM